MGTQETKTTEVEVIEEKKGKVKFNLQQYKNPTPVWAKNVFRCVFFAAVLWSFLGPTFKEIPEHILSSIDTWMLRGTGAIRIAIIFFGLDYQEDNNR